MKSFYKRLKRFTAVVWAILSIILLPACLHSAAVGEPHTALLCLFVEAFGTLVCFILLYYYGNIVIDVSFSGQMTVIQTNRKSYTLPSNGFYEVIDSDSLGRIFLKYADQNGKKTFVFQKQYSPFRKYTLNIAEMKRHMPQAAFKKG